MSENMKTGKYLTTPPPPFNSEFSQPTERAKPQSPSAATNSCGNSTWTGSLVSDHNQTPLMPRIDPRCYVQQNPKATTQSDAGDHHMFQGKTGNFYWSFSWRNPKIE
ncbi:hypothetical protein M0R45_016811 [Rubus argutus]|uniref:Uncharacterized protein n=1 Tax=Rubus argutus TaxID=59490 RepID=A0AAW1XTK0_RUBAR